MVVYNSFSNSRDEVIQIGVQISNIKVLDGESGNVIESQIIPVSDITRGIPAETSNGLPNVNNFLLYFPAKSIPPTGFSTFILTVVDDNDTNKAQLTTPVPLGYFSVYIHTYKNYYCS